MSELGDIYDAYHERQRAEKKARLDDALVELKRRGIGYQTGKSCNIIIAGRFELWPSTHAWFDRQTGKRGRGIGGFYAMLKEAGIADKRSTGAAFAPRTEEKMRLIDADAKELTHEFGRAGGRCAYDVAKRILDAAPVIEAEPVRHGRWMIEVYNPEECETNVIAYDPTIIENPYGTMFCSECKGEPLLNGQEEVVPSAYCPNCGARMDGGASDGTE